MLSKVIFISEQAQSSLLRKVNTKELKEIIELANSVIHNAIAHSMTEMNKLLYVGVYAVAVKLSKMKKNNSSEAREKSWWKKSIQVNTVD